MSLPALVRGDMHCRATEFKALAPECGVLWSSGGSVLKASWMPQALGSGEEDWLQGVSGQLGEALEGMRHHCEGTSWVCGQDQAGWRQLSRGGADVGKKMWG